MHPQPEAADTPAVVKAEHISLRGVVQGVGIRPTIFRLAQEFALTGWVNNCNKGAELVVSGEAKNIALFKQALVAQAPPLSKIESLNTRTRTYELQHFPRGFEIRSSPFSAHQRVDAVMGCDAAVCENCKRELNDPANRRFRYAFTNCTDCGPRFSIAKSLPFDRQNTSMASFPMCEHCREEYGNPLDRRFHAQAICCSNCGPQLRLLDNKGNTHTPLPGEDEIQAVARLLRQGKIVAIKGLGGFHLACVAEDENALAMLRKRKQRPTKPFALMALNIAQIKNYVTIDTEAEALLSSVQAPIVLLQKSHHSTAAELPALLAPAQGSLGFMLPYTPLHLLLMQAVGAPLVMTSGNKHSEPQCIQNDDALEKLADIADYFLLHNRDIVHRLDDSVVKFNAVGENVLRRARGYAPQLLPEHAEIFQGKEILAMGGEQKNSLCWIRDNRPLLSAYIGDLFQVEAFKAYKHTLHDYQTTFQLKPTLVAVDQHPGYHSRQLGIDFANAHKLPIVSVQHHHAHIASCMLENNIKPNSGKVLGVVLDGSGYAEDGTVWGGEFMVADYREAERCGHFQQRALPGGEQAVVEPWRNAYAHLRAMDWRKLVREFSSLDCIQKLQAKPLTLIDSLIARKLNSPLTSSAGRVFDAAAALLGICLDRISFEGEAAMQLETLAGPDFSAVATRPYPYGIQSDGIQAACISWESTWIALLKDVKADVPKARIAARFHQTVASAVSELAIKLCVQKTVSTVVLSGGVFQNNLLLESCVYLLEQAQLRVLTHKNIPANDGGIAPGQAAVAAQSQI